MPLNEKSFDLKEFLKLSKEKKSSRAALIVKEFDEAPVEDVMENNKDFMLLHGKQVRDYVTWRQERERRLKFAKAQAQKGICRACARLLQRMEQRDCFLADNESSTEEEAPAEAALDPGPGGDRKDHLSDDDGGDLFSQHLPVA